MYFNTKIIGIFHHLVAKTVTGMAYAVVDTCASLSVGW